MRVFKTLVMSSTILSSMVIAGQVAAQDAAPAPAADQPTEVVITGTHLKRKDMNAASPVTTITATQAEQNGSATVADLLQKVPQAANSQQTNTLLGGYVVTGGSGVETLSLYGLGAQNTLVLLNGRRLGPAGIGGTVGPIDLNVLPLDALKQVDIVLDGSSAIYGSDAVGGVVNFITKKNADGLDIIVHGDVPVKEGGSTYTTTITGGKTFGKGYVSFLASYNEDTGLTLGQRNNLRCAEDVFFDPTTGARSDFLGTDGKFKCFNLLNNAAQGYQYGGVFQYDPTGTRYPGVPAGTAGHLPGLPDWVRAGRSGRPNTYPYENYDTPKLDKQTVIQPVKTATVFLSGGYDLSETSHLYSELLYNHRQSTNHGIYQLFPWVPGNNPTNVLADALYANFPPSYGYARPIIAYDNVTTADVDYVRGVVGINGTFTNAGFLSGFSYDTNYQISSSSASYGQSFIYNDRVNAATTYTGPACDPTFITFSNASCVTIPWFSDDVLNGKFTKEQQDFLFGFEKGKTKYLFQSIEGNIAGDLWQLPAGAVSAVAGIYLEDHQMIDTPGYNARNSNYWGFSTTGITKGRYSSTQAYAEFYIPLIKNVPLIKNLDVTLSGRYAHYSHAGDSKTYKYGIVWNLTNAFALTVTHGTSFRAPTVYEAHLANQTGFVDLSDPCTMWGDSTNTKIRDRCAAEGIPDDYGGALQSTTVYTGGGSNLRPETANNTNIGFAWTPAFADLKVTVNYNTISDNNTITNFGAQNIVSACYGGQEYPNYFCSQFERDNNFDIVTLHDNYINIANVRNENVGMRIDYKKKFTKGRLSIFSDSSWQVKNAQTISDQTVDYTGSVGYPVFTNQTNVNYSTGDWTYHWGFNVAGKQSDLRYYTDNSALQAPTPNYPNGYVIKAVTPVYFIHNLAVTKRFDKFRITAGVDNLFDEQAPVLSSGEFRVGIAALNMYDLRGRTVYFTVAKHF